MLTPWPAVVVLVCMFAVELIVLLLPSLRTWCLFEPRQSSREPLLVAEIEKLKRQAKELLSPDTYVASVRASREAIKKEAELTELRSAQAARSSWLTRALTAERLLRFGVQGTLLWLMWHHSPMVQVPLPFFAGGWSMGVIRWISMSSFAVKHLLDGGGGGQ